MSIGQWLRQRGWKTYLGTWWFKPLPGWGGRIAPGQEIYGQSRAYEIERKTAVVG